MHERNRYFRSIPSLFIFSPLDELVEEIQTMCKKNIQSIKNLKKYNIPNIDLKIGEIQQRSNRFLSINSNDLKSKKLPLSKLDKIKNKCVNHIDKLLNQERYLQQISSKCSFLQDNCYTLKEDSEEDSLDKSDTLTSIMKVSNANLSQLTIPETESDLSDSPNKNVDNLNISKNEVQIRQRQESPKVSKREYDNLFNEHMKALETIKELKRRIVQNKEEENLNRFNGKKNNEQKENTIKKNNQNGVYFSFYCFLKDF